MKKLFILSFVTLMSIMMMSCIHVKVGDKDWSLDNIAKRVNDTPTQVDRVGQEIRMQPFDKLNVVGPFNVIYTQGEGHSVRVDATVEQLEKITIYVKDEGLYVDQRESKWRSNDFNGMRIFVTSNLMTDIELAGSGTVTAPDAISTADLGLEVAGSGEITLAELTCKDLDIEIAGSGDVTTGPIHANSVKNQIAGWGDIEIMGLTCQRLQNEIAGSGNINLSNMNVDGVTSEIAGSGNVILSGRVGSHKESIAGSGRVDVSGLD